MNVCWEIRVINTQNCMHPVVPAEAGICLLHPVIPAEAGICRKHGIPASAGMTAEGDNCPDLYPGA